MVKVFLALLFLAPVFATAGSNQVMFEGYYKTEINGKHAGFSVYQWSEDTKLKTRTLKTFLKTKTAEIDAEEMFKATSQSTWKPISYEFKSRVGKVYLKQWGKFPKAKSFELSTAKPKGGADKELYEISEQGVLSSAIPGLVKHHGLKKGEALEFEAVSEEDGVIFPVTVYCIDETSHQNTKLFHFLLAMDMSEIDLLVNENSETLVAANEKVGLKSFLVANYTTATEGIEFNENTFNEWFGFKPFGNKNPHSPDLARFSQVYKFKRPTDAELEKFKIRKVGPVQ